MTSTGISDWLKRVARWSKRVEDSLLVLLLTAMILIGGWQIFMRNVVGVSLSWADESQRLLLLWLTLLGAVAASRDRKQLRIDLASRYLRGLPRHALEAISDLLTAVVSGIIGWYSLLFVRESYAYGDLLAGVLPAWMIQSVLPLAFFLMAWRHLLDGVLAIMGRTRVRVTGP
jgi:TRAP-type C4-dicarboxylate transport system permease small subunit